MTLTEALNTIHDFSASPDKRRDAWRCIDRYLNHLAHGNHDREEAAQRVLVRLWRAGASTLRDRTEAQARRYLARALWRSTVDLHRGSASTWASGLEVSDLAAEPPRARDERVALLRLALHRLETGDVPRALALRKRADHRRELAHGLAVRASALRAFARGRRPQPRSPAEDRAARRAAEALETAFPTPQPHPVNEVIRRLGALDLRKYH